MYNNALFGFMLQKVVCDKFNISNFSEKLKNIFESNYDVRLVQYINKIVSDVFETLNLKPIECTTLNLDEKGKKIPFNFILSDNSTLSIRTNISGCKVAPRVIGQAGFDTLNYFFKDINGASIDSQDDIKHLFFNKIDKILPIFFDQLFDADYILWIFQDKANFSYHLIKGNSDIGIVYERENFTFTRNYEQWVESTTLKYKNISIAEIQVHKNRSFKFRFIMKNIIPLFISNENTTETLGITAEKTICDIFNLSYPKNFFNRYSIQLQYILEDIIRNAFMYLPKPIEHSGSKKGIRGGNSKCSYDFLLYGNKTLSLKTNVGTKVCPPEVGQPNDKTCYLYFKHLIKEDYIDKEVFKKMVYEHIEEMLPIYTSHMFDSDYLLWIFKNRDNSKLLEEPYEFKIFEKNLGDNFIWHRDKIAFSKKKIEEWNESNTVYYDGLSVGEFQIHNNRNCFKFRFNFGNLMKILSK